jgi:hypothetical protein
MAIADNLARVRERIATAAGCVGRSAAEITLMAVSKTFPAERILEAYTAGVRVFGENRVQEFAGKAPMLHGLEGAEFHLIGHLQSNKAAKAVELFNAVDSVDSARLARKLNEAAGRLGRRLPVLIEVNLAGEEQKSGVADGSYGLKELLDVAPSLEHLEFRGLMAIPPYSEDPETARPFFRKLREMCNELTARNLPGISFEVLSMGMSHDFEVALAEGATCVRIGTAIFGDRTIGPSGDPVIG